jgi:5-methylcytosine-specific restriction endonuclease McrA
MSLTDRTFPLCERSTSGGSLRVVVAGPDALSMASVRLPSMNTRSTAARHCGEQQHSERAGCGPCPCRRLTRRPSARAERHRDGQRRTGPYRATLAGSPATVHARSGGTWHPCSLCGAPIDWMLTRLCPRHRLAGTAHHIVGLAQGGDPLDPSNLTPAHRGCNTRHSNRLRALARKPRKPPPPFVRGSRNW